MTRKAFRADFAAIAQSDISGLVNISRGEEDGEFHAIIKVSDEETLKVNFLATDTSEYPLANNFLIFIEDDEVSKAYSNTLEELQAVSTGFTIEQIIEAVIDCLRDGEDVGLYSTPALEISEDSEDELFSDRDQYWNCLKLSSRAAVAVNERIRQDIRKARSAGYRYGIISGMKADSCGSILSLSVRVSKLSLSKDALQAWSLKPEEYIIMMIKYTSTYKTFSDFVNSPCNDLFFRIGVSTKYKPSMKEAEAEFGTESTHAEFNLSTETDKITTGEQLSPTYRKLFNSKSLQELMDKQFQSIVKIRINENTRWDSAIWVHNKREKEVSPAIPKEILNAADRQSRVHCTYLSEDHMSEEPLESLSLPLLAAQFLLRYTVRCTEFCAVCYERLDSELQFLKPYTCNSSLCRFQYLRSFGPNIDFEIKQNPLTVDLLVSFCYSAAMSLSLREFPIGGIIRDVPRLSRNLESLFQQPPPAKLPKNTYRVRINPESGSLTFHGSWSSSPIPVREKQWATVSIQHEDLHYTIHLAIKDTSLFPLVLFDKESATSISHSQVLRPQLINGHTSATSTTAASPSPVENLQIWPNARQTCEGFLALYDQSFDDLDDAEKSQTIITLLSLAPSIETLAASQCSVTERSTRWSEATISLLRWIIASNRSSINQVQTLTNNADKSLTQSMYDQSEALAGLPKGWMQFKFAQGTPEKEEAFIQTLISAQDKPGFNSKIPTLFGWHGSRLGNWHSIIRTGLDFTKIESGRAYGNGCYHARKFSYSEHYTKPGPCWPKSVLQPTKAMCLNEIVNLPNEFVSKDPFLVVQHPTWIQCRYLLVQSGVGDVFSLTSGPPLLQDDTDMSKPSGNPPMKPVFMEQDPVFTVLTKDHGPLMIPRDAIPTRKALEQQKKFDNPEKKRKTYQASELDSEDSDLDDLMFLCPPLEDGEEDEKMALTLKSNRSGSTPDLEMAELPVPDLGHKISAIEKNLLPYTPGSLNLTMYRMLEPPAYATPIATGYINAELRAVAKLMKDKKNIPQLGWWMDLSVISNIYQWVVELHSFDLDLPLAKDMKKAGLSSIILEIRFSSATPSSPPFIRVVHPRFRQFSQGGGGHVTAGGSICMDLLTNTGWSIANTMESVLMQVRMAIASLEPPARLESTSERQGSYSFSEAINAFRRVATAHGWEIPKGLADFSDN